MKACKGFLTAWWCLAMVAAPGIYAKKPVPQPVDSLRNEITQLQQQMTDLIAAVASSDTLHTVAAQKAVQDLQEQLQELTEKVNAVSEGQKKVLPGEFNPAIGLVGEEVTSYQTKGKAETGGDRPGGIDVNLRSVELNVASAIDPFAKGYAVVNASADPLSGEATWGIEEAALQTTSLPGNLELKAGRFFGEFGRLAYIHDHELPMVNRPLALDQYIGGESQSDGFQFNWLVPLPQYLSLTGGAGDHFGADYPRNEVGDFRHLNALNYWGRLSSYFDLTQDWEVELGVSGLLNPATDPGIASMQDGDSLMETERRLAGADFSLKWAPLRNNQFQSLTWGNEVLLSDNRYTGSIPTVSSIPVDTTIESWGLYSYLTWKFTREWSAGFLFNWVENAMDSKDRTAEYSPCITWAMSHWNQVRLEYTYTRHNDISGLPDNHAVYLQWAWIIGAHAHGWQQR